MRGLRKRWDCWRFGIVSRSRMVVLSAPQTTIKPSGLVAVRYRTRLLLFPGDLL